MFFQSFCTLERVSSKSYLHLFLRLKISTRADRSEKASASSDVPLLFCGIQPTHGKRFQFRGSQRSVFRKLINSLQLEKAEAFVACSQ